MISWKLFWIVGSAVCVAAGAALMALAAVPAAVAIGLLGLAAIVFWVSARSVVQRAAMFEPLTFEQQQRIVRLLGAAAAAHVAWGTAFTIRPELWFGWLVALAVLGGVEFLIAQANEYALTKLKPAEIVKAERTAATRPVDARDMAVAKLREALARCRKEYLNCLGYTVVTAGTTGRPVGIMYRLQVPSQIVAAEKNKKESTVSRLDDSDREPLAIAFSEVLGIPIHSDWVQIMKEPAAGVYTLSVTVEDVLAAVYPYVDDPRPASINDRVLIAHEIDGTPITQQINRHGADTGSSQKGKSSLVHVRMAHVTKCPKDAAQWVCGVVKLYDLVSPWTDPYQGTDNKIPLHWVAAGVEHTALMLGTGFAIARARQNAPMAMRDQFKEIIIELDEASFALPIPGKVVFVDGVWYSLSEIVRALEFGATSEKVKIHLAGQRATKDNWGSEGGNINSGLQWQTVFATGDKDEIGRAMDNYKLPVPTHPGECWINLGTDPQPGDDRVILKGKCLYMQETNKGKKVLHSGATIADVSWARRIFEHELDAFSEAVANAYAGDVYANRHRYATDALDAYLRGRSDIHAPAVAASEYRQELSGGPARAGAFAEAEQQITEELQAMIAAAPWNTSGDGAVAGSADTGGGVATLVGKRTLKERIVDVVTAAGGPVTFAEICESLGDVKNRNTVTNALTGLVRDGELRRPETNVYQAAS